jgi:tetratricopeptide (TPR) repeat protein
VAAGAAGALLLLAAVVVAPPRAAAAFKFLKPGMPAADFSFRTLDDREITLATIKQSPASLIVFWATWSPRSEQALRDAQGFLERYGARGLAVVALNTDRAVAGLRPREAADKAMAAWGVTLPVAIDEGLATSTSFGVVASPAAALLDAQGVLVHEVSSWSKAAADGCREQIEALLGLRPAAPQAAQARGPQPAHRALLSYNLGRNLLRQGERAKAIDMLDSAAQADAGWAPPRTLLGHLLLQEGTEESRRRAEELFRDATRLDPADVAALSGLGEALLAAGRFEEAAAALEKAAALDGTYTPAVTGRALALTRLGRNREALELFDAALALNPREAAAYAGRGECRRAGNDLAGAAGDYRQAVEILLGSR